jgi:putative membrane protein
MRLLALWLIHALALLGVSYLVPAVQISSFGSALIAALVLGLVNTLIRPILVLLTLPVTILTLGLFVFVINGALFLAVANILEGFQVAGLGWAILGAIVYSLFSWMLSAVFLGAQGRAA